MPTIEINGQSLEAEDGQMIIEVADAAGIYIPRFCYHEKLTVAANCRMCMVEVEKAPKPLAACATPVADGMKISTRSTLAREAQQGTMEFLLINHPLDCPVCDQGGECPLQDQAVGYGKSESRFYENKRVVKDKDIGPLIAMEMTRCIHCTRCVRFGQEVAGIMELGTTGRGEHMEIGTYVEQSMDSEVSGNVIDLCPVGALTDKTYRFSARPWELSSHDAISPHDCVGTNINIQTADGQVKRVVSRANEKINECWISDRDRYSYQALQCEDRLTEPMVRENGQWRTVDWQTALEVSADGIKKTITKNGADSFGALVSPTATTEEGYLTQKLVRGLGCQNVDHRLRQRDFSHDDITPAYPGLGSDIEQLERASTIVLIGSNIRKEQPLLGLRVRKASEQGSQVSAINSYAYDYNFDLHGECVVTPSQIPATLARIIKHITRQSNQNLPKEVDRLATGKINEEERKIAESLIEQGHGGHVILGLSAISHDDYSALYALAETLSTISGATLGILSESNSPGLSLAGCLPTGPSNGALSGKHTMQMLSGELSAMLLVGVEPELDCLAADQAKMAQSALEFGVLMTAFKPVDDTGLNVLLPMATFAETSGSYINCSGLSQSFKGAIQPPHDARPGWKILRVLGNMLKLNGFDYMSSPEVTAEVQVPQQRSSLLKSWRLGEVTQPDMSNQIDLQRIVDVPLYRVDPIVRRASALQSVSDTPVPSARLSAAQAKKLNITNGSTVNAHHGNAVVELPVSIDSSIPDGCVWIPSGYQETARLALPVS